MDSADFSLNDLFFMECEAQCETLLGELCALEEQGSSPERLEVLMRAAHSLKGAARIVGFNQSVRLAHAMEDQFVEAQHGDRVFAQNNVDRLLEATELLKQMGAPGGTTDESFADQVSLCIEQLKEVGECEPKAVVDPESVEPVVVAHDTSVKQDAAKSGLEGKVKTGDARYLRVKASSLDCLLARSAESLVASRRIHSFHERLWGSMARHRHISNLMGHAMAKIKADDPAFGVLCNLRQAVDEGDQALLDYIGDLSVFERETMRLAQRLYDQALNCRMRPFSELSVGLRMAARDAARHTGRDVAFEIVGESTEVDRDLLEKLESPLGHLVRNAIEHGLEDAHDRVACGKTVGGSVSIEASHVAGSLVIRISDDGRGIDLAGLRKKIVDRDFADQATVDVMEQSELLDFLFLPGFSMKETVTEMSGRGVGLDVVRSLAAELRGMVRVTTEPGQGTQFSLQFPVSLSVMRVLLFEISGELYAMQLGRVDRVMSCSIEDVVVLGGRQYLDVDDERVPLFCGAELLGKERVQNEDEAVSLLILGDERDRVGVRVDRFCGEGEVVVQPLDPNLGRVRNVLSAGLTESGEALLILDPDDFVLSLSRLMETGGTRNVVAPKESAGVVRPRILVVEDSLTVRELERKLLMSHGYDVEVAVDGVDGWNTLRSGDFAAVVTDIDMPRMDGFELTKMIKVNGRLKHMPVIIVSYKDRVEDRQRGVAVGADYYLTKGSFRDEGLVHALKDLLGAPKGS